MLLFKWRIISGQQRPGQSARRIVINNQNPFKIVHAIWLELNPPDTATRMDERGAGGVAGGGVDGGCTANDSINASSSGVGGAVGGHWQLATGSAAAASAVCLAVCVRAIWPDCCVSLI